MKIVASEYRDRMARAIFDARWTSLDNDVLWSLMDRTNYRLAADAAIGLLEAREPHDPAMGQVA